MKKLIGIFIGLMFACGCGLFHRVSPQIVQVDPLVIPDAPVVDPIVESVVEVVPVVNVPMLEVPDKVRGWWEYINYHALADKVIVLVIVLVVVWLVYAGVKRYRGIVRKV